MKQSLSRYAIVSFLSSVHSAALKAKTSVLLGLSTQKPKVEYIVSTGEEASHCLEAGQMQN